MTESHTLTVVESDDRITVFLCDRCGRRLLIDRETRDYTVIVQGDVMALHNGTSGPVTLTAKIDPQRQLGGSGRDTDTLERTGTPDPRHIQCCVDPFEFGKCGAPLDTNTYLTEHPADCPLCFLAEELAGPNNCPRGLGRCP